MAKKRSKTSRKSGVHHETNAKAILSLLVLLIAFGVFMLFNNYQDSLLSTVAFQYFLVFTVILFALLFALLFLINPQRK